MLERFSDKYAFEKPNDRRGIDLMNSAAKAVLKELPDIVIAYGISDEYRYMGQRIFHIKLLSNSLFFSSFVLHKSCTLFERRSRYTSLSQTRASH
jgi:tRNA(His) guanylyltransferase